MLLARSGTQYVHVRVHALGEQVEIQNLIEYLKVGVTYFQRYAWPPRTEVVARCGTSAIPEGQQLARSTARANGVGNIRGSRFLQYDLIQPSALFSLL